MQAPAFVLAGPLKAKPFAWPCSQRAPLIVLDFAHRGTLERQQAPPGVDDGGDDDDNDDGGDGGDDGDDDGVVDD